MMDVGSWLRGLWPSMPRGGLPFFIFFQRYNMGHSSRHPPYLELGHSSSQPTCHLDGAADLQSLLANPSHARDSQSDLGDFDLTRNRAVVARGWTSPVSRYRPVGRRKGDKGV